MYSVATAFLNIDSSVQIWSRNFVWISPFILCLFSWSRRREKCSNQLRGDPCEVILWKRFQWNKETFVVIIRSLLILTTDCLPDTEKLGSVQRCHLCWFSEWEILWVGIYSCEPFDAESGKLMENRIFYSFELTDHWDTWTNMICRSLLSVWVVASAENQSILSHHSQTSTKMSSIQKLLSKLKFKKSPKKSPKEVFPAKQEIPVSKLVSLLPIFIISCTKIHFNIIWYYYDRFIPLFAGSSPVTDDTLSCHTTPQRVQPPKSFC